MVSGFATINTHVDFEMVDGSFDDGSDFISIKSLFRITLNAKGNMYSSIFS